MMGPEEFIRHASSVKRGRFVWTRPRISPGRYNGPTTSELRYGGAAIAKAQADKEGNLWFWYGLNRNTASNCRPLDVVQAEALEYAKSILDEANTP